VYVIFRCASERVSGLNVKGEKKFFPGIAQGTERDRRGTGILKNI
jgi:hypothetical protein